MYSHIPECLISISKSSRRSSNSGKRVFIKKTYGFSVQKSRKSNFQVVCSGSRGMMMRARPPPDSAQ